MKKMTKNIFFFAVAGAFVLSPLTAQKKKGAAKAATADTAAENAGPDNEVIPPEVSEADKKAATTEVRDSYYVERRSYGTKRIDGTKPDYAVRLSETGIGIFKKIDWLIAGVDYRYRQEYRGNDLRRPNATTVSGPSGVQPTADTPALLRTRLFLKVENILDPFRFTVEIEDARRYRYWDPAQDPGKDQRQPPYARDDRDFNTAEPIQAFGELYFKNLFGYDRPLHVRVGRQAFEFLDRRLIGLNEWRNTTNTFQGVRTTIGQEKTIGILSCLHFNHCNAIWILSISQSVKNGFPAQSCRSRNGRILLRFSLIISTTSVTVSQYARQNTGHAVRRIFTRWARVPMR